MAIHKIHGGAERDVIEWKLEMNGLKVTLKARHPGSGDKWAPVLDIDEDGVLDPTYNCPDLKGLKRSKAGFIQAVDMFMNPEEYDD